MHPLDDGHKRQSVIGARTLPSQFLKTNVFFPQKDPIWAPVGGRAFLPFWGPFGGLSVTSQKTGFPPKCRKRGVGVNGPIFHLFCFFQETHVSLILMDIE